MNGRAEFVVDWDGTLVAEYDENGKPYWPEMGDWLPGAVEALCELVELGKTVIYSLRCHRYEMDDKTARPNGAPEAQQAKIRAMLDAQELQDVDVYPSDRGKPPARFYIDDRGIRFNGDWQAVLGQIRASYGPSESVCQEADRIVSLDRQAVYGHPAEDFARTAAFWTVRFGHKLKDGERFEPDEVAAAMRLLKESRLVKSPRHRDSLVDLCGYSKTQELVWEALDKPDTLAGMSTSDYWPEVDGYEGDGACDRDLDGRGWRLT